MVRTAHLLYMAIPECHDFANEIQSFPKALRLFLPAQCQSEFRWPYLPLPNKNKAPGRRIQKAAVPVSSPPRAVVSARMSPLCTRKWQTTRLLFSPSMPQSNPMMIISWRHDFADIHAVGRLPGKPGFGESVADEVNRAGVGSACRQREAAPSPPTHKRKTGFRPHLPRHLPQLPRSRTRQVSDSIEIVD